MRTRTLNPDEQEALVGLCRVAGKLALKSGEVGKKNFHEKIRILASKGRATEGQMAVIVRHLDEFKAGKRRPVSRNGGIRGNETVRQRSVHPRLPALSFLKDGAA